MIKYYKGFDKDLSCKKYKFEIGKSYSTDGELIYLVNGFHCCKEILNCIMYYKYPCSRYCEIEIGETYIIIDDIDTIVAKDITIIREITGEELRRMLTGVVFGDCFKQCFKNGLRHGEFLTYHTNRSLMYRSYWKDGIQYGKQQEWYPNGKLSKEIMYDNNGMKIYEKNFTIDGVEK